MAPYKRASSELKRERTVVKARGLEVGGDAGGRDRRPVLGRERGADRRRWPAQLKALGATGLRGGAFKPRTSPYSFQGHKELGLKMLADRARRDRPGDRHRGHGPRARPDGRRVRRRAPDRRPQHAELSAPPGRRRLGQARPAQARDERDGRRVPPGRRVHPRPGQPQRHALRARHPHLRGPHPVHAAAGDGSLPARQEPPAGRGRPLARHGQGAAGRADGQGRRSPPGPTA